MQDFCEEHINEDDEVILELDLSSMGNFVAKPKRHESKQWTLPCIIFLSIFMTCGIGASVVALYAQIVSISDSDSVWYNMAVSSGMTINHTQNSSSKSGLTSPIIADNFQRTNVETILRLNQSLHQSIKTLDSVLTDSKSSIESRWMDAQVMAAARMQKAISWKRLSQIVTNLTESFFASSRTPESFFASTRIPERCEPCRNEELLVASVNFDVGLQIPIPNISLASPALKFWNNSVVSWSHNMSQSAIADKTSMLGKLSS
jgi:hypothetical protein